MAPANNPTWGFGSMPMGSAGLQGQRPSHMATFAQSLGGGQPSAPLDLSDFPSLSSNASQLPNNSQSTWNMPSTRQGGPALSRRIDQSSIPGQQQSQGRPHDDLFSPTSQVPASQAPGFRFGQNTVPRLSQDQNSGSGDFPSVHGGVGDIGQDRTLNLLQNVNNGLLSAVNSGKRTASPGQSSSSRQPESSQQVGAPGSEREAIGFGRPSQSEVMASSNRAPAPVATGNGEQNLTSASGQPPQDQANAEADHQVQDDGIVAEDPLPGMSDRDRYGIKGFFAMLRGQHGDQPAISSGLDIHSLGLDLSTPERLAQQIWSPFDDVPSRPVVQPHTIPDCYKVVNVAPIEAKLPNFSEETLMFMFYNNPQSDQQILAAEELRSRNWRYHKKLQMWLTKDDMMQPIQLGQGLERGFYVIFDPKTWTRDRREMLLNHDDLENIVMSVNARMSIMGAQ